VSFSASSLPTPPERNQQFRNTHRHPGTSNSSVDVITYHYDNGRSGMNLNETILDSRERELHAIRKKGEFIVDGKV